MTSQISQPLQTLCHIIQSLGNDENFEKMNVTDLALEIVKLMKIKDNFKSFDTEENLTSLNCFVCHEKGLTKSQFISHFRKHFKMKKNKRRRGQRRGQRDLESDDDEEKDSDKKIFQRLKVRKTSKTKSIESDSGCQSIESNSSGDENEFSDCLGDSESSSSENERKNISLSDRLSLAEKQLDDNETEGLICLTCLKRFSNIQNLRRHLRLHIARDSITPDIERDLDEDYELTLHGKYFCDWCPARFENRAAARIHEISHKGHETKCYVCDKVYADRYSLRYHLRTHGIGRQIRCEYCNKSFSKPSRLESHIKSHHQNIRDFPCNICQKAFKTRIHLSNHFRQHSGEKPFSCSLCPSAFRHKASLLTHMRSHEGVKPYCCEICGKTFREPSTLKAHSRIHTGDKPYNCDTCSKSFSQRAGLNYHKRIHSRVSGEERISKGTLPSFDHLRSSSTDYSSSLFSETCLTFSSNDLMSSSSSCSSSSSSSEEFAALSSELIINNNNNNPSSSQMEYSVPFSYQNDFYSQGNGNYGGLSYGCNSGYYNSFSYDDYENYETQTNHPSSSSSSSSNSYYHQSQSYCI